MYYDKKPVINELIAFLCVETTGFDGVVHANETMDAASESPALFSEDIPWLNR